jgi:hypothetical protein
MTDYHCKDCIHSRISTFDKYGSYIFEFRAPRGHSYRCAKTAEPEKKIIDPVIGPTKIKAKLNYCDSERKHGDCGMDAKFWSPKKKKDLFKMLTKEHVND